MTELRRQATWTLDVADAFVREAGAALASASEGRYHRQSLRAGMPGSYRSSAAAITTVRTGMRESAARLAGAADERLGMADELEPVVLTVSEAVATSSTRLSSSALGLLVSAHAAVTESDRARETVLALTRPSDEIQQVVQLISAAAARTRLLALDATIEAARAGGTWLRRRGR